MQWFCITLVSIAMIVVITLVILFFRKLWYVVDENSLIVRDNNKKLIALSEFLNLTGTMKGHKASSTSQQTTQPPSS